MLLVVVLLAPAFLLVAMPAASQTSGDPWWDVSDRSRPTAGYAVRVPVVVENPYPYTLFDHLAHVDIDFGALLVEAGWTNETAGANAVLRGFTLDVNSIRVVEYARGFAGGPIGGLNAKPIPHTFYLSPFDAERYRDFDESRNPAGALLFQVTGALPSKEKRYYYVYANPEQYEAEPAQPYPHEPKERAILDSYLWGSRGTVAYGFEPQQSGANHLVYVKPTAPGTTHIEAFQYNLGRYTPVPRSAQFDNPVDVSAGATATFRVPTGAPFKIVADKPVIVMGGRIPEGGANHEAWGFVPSSTGSFTGREFDLVGFRRTQVIDNSGSVWVVKVSPGPVTVTYTHQGGGFRTKELSGATIAETFALGTGRWNQIFATGDIMVSWGAFPVGTTPVHTTQVPAYTGGPEGLQFPVALSNDGGFLRVCTEQEGTFRLINQLKPSEQAYPEGPRESTAPAPLAPSLPCGVVRATAGTPPDTLLAMSRVEETYPDLPAMPFRLLTGTENPSVDGADRAAVGHYGGVGGIDFFTIGRTGILGHFNDTRITVQEARVKDGQTILVNRSLAIGADGFLALDPTTTPGHTGHYRILATKPVSVVSTESVEYPSTDPVAAAAGATFSHSYGRYVPGRPQELATTLGDAEFRGPLVELRSPDTDARQLFRSTGPGSPIDFRLDAINLGRWMGGERLADTIAVSCSEVVGWKIEGCEKELRLDGGTGERLTISVTPSEADVNDIKTVLVTARSTTSGVSATFRLIVYVEIRYGVGMWLGEEGGAKTQDPPIGLKPGGEHTYRVVIKNTGTTPDTYTLTIEEPRAGWKQELRDADGPVTRVELDRGERKDLFFHVVAPDAETAPQNLVSISAKSVTSALAGDVVNTATRIKPNVSISMSLEPQTRVASPNESARFNVTVLNSGNDIFRILFNQDNLLPAGWKANFTIDPPEIDLSPNINFSFGLLVTPPPDARAGDLATLKLSAEADAGGGEPIPGDEDSAVVVVRRIHNITASAPEDARIDAGDTLRYVLPIRNDGNGQDAIEILPGAVSVRALGAEADASALGWRVETDEANVPIAYNASLELPLEITVPAHTPPGPYNLTFTLRLSREDTQNLTLPIDVQRSARLDFVGATSLRTSPGRSTLLEMEAFNAGNVPGSFRFDATLPEGWSVRFEPESAQLAAGARIPVRVLLNASAEAADGVHDVQLRAFLDGESAGATPLPTTLARPLLFLDDIQTTGKPTPGELILVSATVGNRGDIAAENVSVALLVDGVAVDKVVLSRVPVNATQVATLNWIPTSRAGDVRILIDPDQEIVQLDRAANAAEVSFGSTLGIPAPALAPVLALLAALALTTRARRRTP